MNSFQSYPFDSYHYYSIFDVMRHILLALTLFITASISYSQIGMTLDEVIEEHGTDYEVQDKGDYDYVIKYEKGERWDIMKFFTLDSGKTICIYVHIMEPKSEINAWINALNESGYVKMDEFIWRDYEGSIEYEVEIFDGGVSVFKRVFFTD